ncbi:unnamed protein product [Nesidiocoris tenuis]|uniref:Uncharacterized protein n=1 Tax=Nesidiocoris tenuis TaxID=355587 RepID=A0A6H5G2D3_9HEMI|nr:unnamed protein product [Nesidiocoris tenuis]
MYSFQYAGHEHLHSRRTSLSCRPVDKSLVSVTHRHELSFAPTNNSKLAHLLTTFGMRLIPDLQGPGSTTAAHPTRGAHFLRDKSYRPRLTERPQSQRPPTKMRFFLLVFVAVVAPIALAHLETSDLEETGKLLSFILRERGPFTQGCSPKIRPKFQMYKMLELQLHVPTELKKSAFLHKDANFFVYIPNKLQFSIGGSFRLLQSKFEKSVSRRRWHHCIGTNL